MIIGGAKIYKQALRFATKIYATEIDCEIEDAEAFFEKSDLDSKTWKEVSRTKNKASQDKKDDFDFDFVEYVTQ